MAKSNESSKNKEIKEVVIGVFVHCEGCKNQVSKCLKGFQGVGEVITDSSNQKIVINGRDLDPEKILERVKNKYNKKAVIISPIIVPREKEKTPAKKPPEAQVKTVVLKMLMHCDGCVTDIEEFIERMPGVMTVEANKESCRVVVRGVMDVQAMVGEIRRRMKKTVEIVKEESEKKSKEEEKSGDGKKKQPEKQEEVVVFHYLPHCAFHHFYSDQNFADDNAFACVVM